MRFLATILFSLAFCAPVGAQGYSYYENSQFDPFQREMYFVGNKTLHSSMRSYKLDDIRQYYDVDSLIYRGIARSTKKKNIFRNLIHDDMLSWRDDETYLAINPFCDFSVGKDGDRNTYINSRGFYVNGNLGRNFWFYMDFTENQAQFQEYFEEISEKYRVVPSLSNYKHETGKDIDYQTATGYIGFNISKWFDFQLGKTKTFIGDGYRSLLLSDAACAYPMIKMNVTAGNVKYMFMIAQLRTTDRHKTSNHGFTTKYSFTHYVDWNFCNRFAVGVFENVVMATWRNDGDYRGIDWEYINPFIILRPGEFNAGSPDKMLVGLNAKFVAADWLSFYGQLMFNEFRLSELMSDKKYWSNKYGYQIGLRTKDLFRVDGLDWLMEFNYVRPFCYSQYEGMATYTHHGGPLAHPLGANFKELVSSVTYNHKRLSVRGQFNYSQYGGDFPNDTLSYGHDPNIASVKRNSQYGVKILQGDLNKIVYGDFAASFLLNPRSRLNATLGMRFRSRKSDLIDEEKSTQFYFALRWSLKNMYYDF